MANEHDAAMQAIGRLTDGDADARADAYAELMRQEERVLRTVNRVVNSARGKTVDGGLFTNLSLNDLGMQTMRTLHVVMHDLMHARKPDQVLRAFVDGDRKIYVGLICIALAFVLFFVSSAS